MRDYGKISTTIWDSRKFSKMSDDARLLYLYLHTCKSVNSVGCFVLKDGYATADLGWDISRYKYAIDRLCEVDLIAFDREESLVRIVNYLTFDPFTNPKHAQGAFKIALGLPDCCEKSNLLKDMKGHKFAPDSSQIDEAIHSLSKRYRNPEPEPEPEPEEAFPSETPCSPEAGELSDAPKQNGPSFDEFWSKWPEKIGRKKAETAWRRMSSEKRRRALVALEHGWFDAWRDQNPRLNPIHPTTFLNGERWNDEFRRENVQRSGSGRYASDDPTLRAIARAAGTF